MGADVVSAIADRVKFRRKARWTQILYGRPTVAPKKDFRDTETNSGSPNADFSFEGSTARAAMFPVRGSRKSHPRIEDEPVGSDPAPSQGGNPRLEEPHNLVERVFGSKVTGAGGDAIPLR